MAGPTSDLSADVVICAYTEDRWDMLCRAVASVQEQSTVPGQILVCVDHNEKLYERCAERWGATGAAGLPAVRVLRNRFAGRLGSARNTAVEQVEADIVAWPLLTHVILSGAGKSYHFGGAFPHHDGPGAGTTATDSWGRLPDWDRVHLVDGSVLPSVPSTTFTLTVMANAHRIADGVLAGRAPAAVEAESAKP